jgi:hypothetical protein
MIRKVNTADPEQLRSAIEDLFTRVAVVERHTNAGETMGQYQALVAGATEDGLIPTITHAPIEEKETPSEE